MIAAITAIVGFLASFAPAVINLFAAKANHAHDERMAQLQLQAQAQGGQISLALEESKADTEQQRVLYGYASGPSGNKVVDALNSLVRPYITMVMFHLWLGIETTILIVGIKSGLDLAGLVAIIWDDPTKAIFGAIMGFWYGNRTLKTFSDQSFSRLPVVKAAGT